MYGVGWEAHPAAATASLLLLLLLNELHGGGRGRGRPHGPHHLDAVLRQRRQAEALAPAHLHLLKLLETAQRKLWQGENKINLTTVRRKRTKKSFWFLFVWVIDSRTRTVFQSRRSTFFIGKCGAFMLQNLVTMVNRRRAKGSPL